MFNPNKILRFLISTLGILAMSLAFFQPASAASDLGATSRRNMFLFLRSADCTGEVVEISGIIHFVNQTQRDGTFVGHFNYQNVTGLGLTSGTIYKVSTVYQIQASEPFPSTFNLIQGFHLISKGSDSNLLITILFHITVNANGEVTATIEDAHAQCT
jgi:hypothetical protein